MNDRRTLSSQALGDALRHVRGSLYQSGTGFLRAVAAHGGPSLPRGQLTRIEQGERGLTLHDWHRLVHALTRIQAPAGPVRALATLLPALPPTIEPLPPTATPQTVVRLRAMIEHLSRRPIPELDLTVGEHRPGASATAFLARYQQMARQIISMPLADGTPLPRDPAAAVHVVRLDPPEVTVAANEACEVRIELRNDGESAWTNRLLLRLGPQVTPTIAQTAPLVPVPGTPAGGVCEIVVPGRGHHIPGTCVVTYVMVHANGWPASPGGISVRIASTGPPHLTTSTSPTITSFFSRKSSSRPDS